MHYAQCTYTLTWHWRGQAEKAMMGLHNRHTMPLMTNTIQMSFAKGEEMEVERADAKLFIGMLARTATEEEVRALVSPYGQVEEVYIMKDKATGQSKGCSFVKFCNKESASAVIDALHQKVTMPGSHQPIIAKWADAPKAKNGVYSLGGMDGGMGMGGNGACPPFMGVFHLCLTFPLCLSLPCLCWLV